MPSEPVARHGATPGAHRPAQRAPLPSFVYPGSAYRKPSPAGTQDGADRSATMPATAPSQPAPELSRSTTQSGAGRAARTRRQFARFGRHRAGRSASLVPACGLVNRPPPAPHRRPTTFPRNRGALRRISARVTLCGDRCALILRERAPGSAGWAGLTAAADMSSHRIRTKFKDRALGRGDGGRVRKGPSGRQSSVRTYALTRAALAAGTVLTPFFTPITA